MSLITSPEFFINVKSIPDEKSTEYNAFFDNELKKITYGLTVNGVHIGGWLYWHLNHWHIYKDIEDPINHDIVRKFSNPDLRDNEWMIQENLTQAEIGKNGLLIFGSRRLGKTEFESSYVGRSATIYEGSENLVTGGNWPDIDLITSKLDKGLSAVHPYFRFERIGDNPRKEMSLGLKHKNFRRVEWSKILIRNFDDGKNTEAAAGTTAKSFLIDEIGKFPFLESFNAAKPSFTSPFGWRCVPILTGTSGLFVPNSDAQKVFENPAAYNFLACEIKGESKKYGLFIPGTKRMEGKYKTTVGDYLKTEKGILIPADSELAQLTFHNTDEEKAMAVIDKEIKEASMSSEPKDILKVKMYFPLNVRDLFLTDDGNDFPIEAAKQHLEYLEMMDITGELCIMVKNADGTVSSKPAPMHLVPADFPLKKDANKDAPVVIWEHPIKDAAPGLYIAGADPYNQSSSTTSPSLGSIIIYKRLFDAVSGKFQRSMVASYTARPRSIKEWHQNVEMLMDYYNAVCMPENEGGTFIQYFDQKNKSHVLADGYNMLKSISPSTTIRNRVIGLPATVSVIRFCMALMIEYCNEEIQVGMDAQGFPMTKLGVTRIPDKALLKEIIAFNTTGNFDRIVAFRHALAYENWLMKFSPIIDMKPPEEDNYTAVNGMNSRGPFLFKPTNPFTFNRPMK